MAYGVSKDDHGTAALNMHPTKCVWFKGADFVFYTQQRSFSAHL